VQIDTTPLDVLAVFDDGHPRRVELTGAIDVATRTICAAVLRPAGTATSLTASSSPVDRTFRWRLAPRCR
jgi:hypothetical protein